MNFSLDDRHRSIRRFLMNALGSPPWTLRTERQPVGDEERPVGVVESASPASFVRAPRAVVPQGDVEKRQTFAVTLYPALADSGAQSRVAAQAVAELLDAALTGGLVAEGDPSVVISAPMRLPVFDFEGVAVKGALRAGPDVPYGWLWVEDCPVQALQDPEDPLRWTVTCALRVSWSQGGRIVDPATPLVGGLVPAPQFGSP